MAVAVVLSAALVAGESPLATLGLGAFVTTASAQDERYPQRRARRAAPQQQQPSFGFPFFGGGWGSSQPSRSTFSDPFRNPFFDRGGFERGGYDREQDFYRRQARPQQAPQVDFSKAPAAPRKEAEASTNVVVLGDSMADWLAYGLEDAFSDTPELGVVRKHRTGSSLIRTEARDSFDWVQGAKDALAGERVDFVVMMIGLGDNKPIRERLPARAAAPKPGEAKPGDAKPADAKPADAKPAETKPEEAPPEAGAVIAPEQERADRPGQLVSHEFRSEKWAEAYAKRLDDTIAALKARRAPVLWVGLPPLRGAKARGDASYLNDLIKDRAEKAGIVYIDVWDGFVDESGEFSNYGPDIIGQNRRLRAGDGVHFTKPGARKLAHYVDREIRRQLDRATPVALPAPSDPAGPLEPAAPSDPSPRPVAGPVVPLTGHKPVAEGLLGGTAGSAPAADPVAARVLVRGEPVETEPNRADNFAWPQRGDTVVTNAVEPVAVEPPPVAAAATRPVALPARPAPPPARTQSAATPARPLR